MRQFNYLTTNCLLVEWEARIDREINRQVHSLFAQLKSTPGITSLVPAYHSLAIHFDPKHWDHRQLQAFILAIPEGEEDKNEAPGTSLRIPVCYSPNFALDHQELAAAKQKKWSELVNLHTENPYRVYLIGFLPGFPYLGALPQLWATPRRAAPRQKVAAGSVGVAGAQTGIYPVDSPGGWSVIGRTPIAIFQPERADPFIFQPGDQVQFYAISEDQFWQMKQQSFTRTDLYA